MSGEPYAIVFRPVLPKPTNHHPSPWVLRFRPIFPESWDPESCPEVTDAEGNRVFVPPQYVGHPGERDAQAIELCQRIIAGVNHLESPPLNVCNVCNKEKELKCEYCGNTCLICQQCESEPP